MTIADITIPGNPFHYSSLTHFARTVLGRMPPAHVDDLCNALAGMTHTERVEMMRYMVARASHAMIPPKVLNPIEAWWLRKLETGILLDGRPEEGWIRMLPIADLTKDYIVGVNRFNLTDKGNATAMGVFLKKVMPKIGKTSCLPDDPELAGLTGRQRSKFRARHYEMPTLDYARKFWEDQYGKRKWRVASDPKDRL